MVDPLRQDITKLMNEIPEFVVEYNEMKQILDGYVDQVIENHKHENMTIARMSSDEPVNSGEVIIEHTSPALTPREDMEEDGDIDDESQITKKMAQQIIKSFNENYDEQTVKNLEQARNTKHSKKTTRELKKYDEQKSLVERLKQRYPNI